MNPLAEGQQITHRAGGALVTLQCIRPDSAYRVTVAHGSTGQPVSELSCSVTTEAAARDIARDASRWLHSGFTIQQLLDAVRIS